MSYSPTVQLRFVNQSETPEPLSVVFYAKNAAALDAIPVAWRVISDTVPGNSVPFDYPLLSDVSASDSFGKVTGILPAPDGSAFSLTAPDSGLELQANGSAPSPAEIVVNNAAGRPMNVSLYKDSRKLFTKTGLPSGQSVVFVNEPKLYMTLATHVQEGDRLDATLLTNVTMIALFGCRSMDIVLVGGGSGTDAKPYHFFPQNMKPA